MSGRFSAPLLALRARSRSAQAAALGAVAVFDKPFDFDDLCGTVRAFAASRALV